MYSAQKYYDNERQMIMLKKGVWLYFLLLIFEGALRKWFLPGLSAPLLIVRDPIALWLIYTVWKAGLLPVSTLLNAMTIIGLCGIVTAVIFGHGNLFVAIFGARILLIHFPMIFVIGCILSKEDVIKIGKTLLWISIPMVLLIALQFYSPQSSFVNRGVGGDSAGAGFSGALGYFRPPGTFSFTNGTHLFFGLCSCYIFYFWLNSGLINRFVLYGATIALMISIPLSISRSLAFHIVIITVFALFAVGRKPENFAKVVFASIGFTVIIIAIFNMDVFKTSIQAFTFRFTSASVTEGGLKGTIGGRYFGGMITAIDSAFDQPFFGYGLGMGTNVGSALLTGGRKFLIAEEEWNRQIGELGALLGMATIFVRLAVSFKMAVFSYAELKINNMLPWLFLGFALTTIPQGQWAQPTALGFSVLAGGLLIASLKDGEGHINPEDKI